MKKKNCILIILIFFIMFLLFTYNTYKKNNKFSFYKQQTNYATDTIVIVDRDSDSNISLLSEIDISDTSEDNVKAKLYSDGVLVIVGTGRMKDNTNIRLWSDTYMANITGVVISDGVTNIGNAMFALFSKMEYIQIPSTVSDIGEYFAMYSGLKSIFISEDNNYFECVDGVLFNKAKTQLVCYPSNRQEILYIIPEGVITIRKDAFIGNKNLQSIQLSASLSEIDPITFLSSNNLTRIEVNSNNQCFDSINGVLFNKEKDRIICFLGNNETTNYVIPDTVSEISDYAFASENNLETLILPDGLINIGENALNGCKNITQIIVPRNVESMPEEIFIELSKLEKIIVYCGSYAEGFVNENNYSDITDVIHNYENGICIVCERASSDHIHTYGDWITLKEATCEEEGKREKICSTCGEIELQTIARTEHRYSDWIIDKVATLKETGLRHRECIICGEREEEEISKLTEEKFNVLTTYTTKKVNNITYIVLSKTTTVSNIINSITSNKVFKIININQVVQTNSTNVGTGFKVMSTDNELAYIIVVKGDINGDGIIDFLTDIVPINNYRLRKITNFTTEAILASDINGNGTIDFLTDIVPINNYRLRKVSTL